jgi:hypothetical protein
MSSVDPSPGAVILSCLQVVRDCRGAASLDASLATAVVEVKSYQEARLRRTHADLFGRPDESEAADFFLQDLYGPTDFSRRDAELARVVPALLRWFPSEVAQTVALVCELHALSEVLDLEMATHIRGRPLTDGAYKRAWRAVSSPSQRRRQVELIVEVGAALAVHTKSRSLRHSLHLMRLPARLAGLSVLQRFLEHGFEVFGSLPNSSAFLNGIAQREYEYAAMQFDGTDSPD